MACVGRELAEHLVARLPAHRPEVPSDQVEDPVAAPAAPAPDGSDIGVDERLSAIGGELVPLDPQRLGGSPGNQLGGRDQALLDAARRGNVPQLVLPIIVLPDQGPALAVRAPDRPIRGRREVVGSEDRPDAEVLACLLGTRAGNVRPTKVEAGSTRHARRHRERDPGRGAPPQGTGSRRRRPLLTGSRPHPHASNHQERQDQITRSVRIASLPR